MRVNSIGQSIQQVMVQGRWNRHLTDWYRQRDGQQAVVLRLAHPVCLVLELHATHCEKPNPEPWNKEMYDTTKHTFDSSGLVCTRNPVGRGDWGEPAGGPVGCLVTNGVFEVSHCYKLGYNQKHIVACHGLHFLNNSRPCCPSWWFLLHAAFCSCT